MAESVAEQTFAPSIGRRLLALVRFTIIVLITLIVTLSLGLLKLAFFFWPAGKRHVRVIFFRIWARSVCRVLGGKTRVHGALPTTQCLLASNHLSYLDILVIAQYVPAVFVSKADVKNWPVISSMTRLGDTIYISRERSRDIPRANADIANALTRGDNVVVFPEGTSSDSEWVLPVRPSLLEIAVRTQTPVTTAAIAFNTNESDPPADTAICYFGDMSFGAHVFKLMHLSGWECDLRLSGDTLYSDDRKTLALDVRRSILTLQSKNNPASPMPDYRKSYAFRKYQ
ncbi:MAG: 1-acyl-sn-glycerol-3-phosphate acyltransferase [Pseudomonadota bacterium]